MYTFLRHQHNTKPTYLSLSPTMLLSMIPVYSPSTWGMKGSSYGKSKAPLSVGEKEMKKPEMRRRLFGINLERKAAAVDGRATSFSVSEGQSDTLGPSKGIGIERYFERKNIFLTGATGLLGKGIAFHKYTLVLSYCCFFKCQLNIALKLFDEMFH